MDDVDWLAPAPTDDVDWLAPALLDGVWRNITSLEFLMNGHLDFESWHKNSATVGRLCKTTAGAIGSARALLRAAARRLGFAEQSAERARLALKEHWEMHRALKCTQDFCEAHKLQVAMAGGMAAHLLRGTWDAEQSDAWRPSDVDIFIGAPRAMDDVQQDLCIAALNQLLCANLNRYMHFWSTGSGDYCLGDGDYCDRALSVANDLDLESFVADTRCTRACKARLRGLIGRTPPQTDPEAASNFRIKGTWRIDRIADPGYHGHEETLSRQFNIIWTDLPSLNLNLGEPRAYGTWITDGFDFAHCAVSARAVQGAPFWEFATSDDAAAPLAAKKIVARRGTFDLCASAKTSLHRAVKYEAYGFQL